MHNKFYLLCIGLLFSCAARGMESDQKPTIIGVIAGKTKVMLLSKYVNESVILKKGIKGDITTVKMSYKDFKPMIPYLKIGCKITQLEQKVANLKNLNARREQSLNVERARCALEEEITAYSKEKLAVCMNAVTKLRINSVGPIALQVGIKKGWIEVKPKAKKREISNSN